MLLVGWLHLLAFSFCYYLTVGRGYHNAPGYLAVWAGELLGAWLIFRACGGTRPADLPPQPLELLVRRIWIAYFVLAFNLGSMNNLAGHELFQLFPAIAPLASFAFLMMTVAVNGRFFGAVLVMFGCGLLMAARLLHAYLIFALVWWLVLNGVGLPLWLERRRKGLAGAAGWGVSFLNSGRNRGGRHRAGPRRFPPPAPDCCPGTG